jgi:hypothetical protein
MSANHIWTDAEKALLTEIAPGRTTAEIQRIMTGEFGDPFGGKRIAAALKRYGISTGVDSRFKKGNEPANKGRTWDEMGYTPEQQERMRATQFKPGHLPHNASQPIGTERVDAKDGYVYVKVAERKIDPRSAHDNWKPKHHLVYEQAHGAIPEGCNVVFADRDRRNFDPANLVAVPRKLWSTITKRKLAYHDADSLRAAMGVARLDQAVHDARSAPRACKACGCEFKPRFVRQRTCDGCLALRRGEC